MIYISYHLNFDIIQNITANIITTIIIPTKKPALKIPSTTWQPVKSMIKNARVGNVRFFIICK